MEKLNETQLEVSRTFEAPLELLWQAWTEPEHFKKWYGPKNFTAPMCEINLEVGGRHFWSMKSPDGMEMFYIGTYKEISPMDRLVYTDSMSDADGNVISPAAMGMPEGSPKTMDVTVSFDFADGQTTVTVSHVSSGPEDRAGTGWEQAFEKLANVLASG